MPRFSFRVDLGQMITLVVVVVAASIAYGKREADMIQLTQALNEVKASQTSLWLEWKTTQQMVVRDSTRLDYVEKSRR